MPITATGGLAAKLKKIREAPQAPPVTPPQAVKASLDDDQELVQAEWDSLTEEELDALSDQDSPEDELMDFSQLVVDPDLPEALELDDESGAPTLPAPDLVNPTEEVEADSDEDDSVECLSDLFRAFFKINKNPSDEQFHALANALGMDHETLEAKLYELVGESINSESVDLHEVDLDD
jgi:hypothetical protein